MENKYQKQPQQEFNKTYVVFDVEQTEKHQSVRKHVENPERITQIINHLNEKKILDKCAKVDQKIDNPVSKEQILNSHTEDYYNFIEGMWPEEMEKPQIMVKDCYINQYTFESAKYSAGGVVQACQEVCSGKCDNGFAIVRPPGHHSGASPICHGFCFLSNVSIAARQMQKEFGLKKILIFDWDVHHGDGTSKIFEDDPNILFISLHRYDNGLYFPKTGHPQDVGSKDGKGYNINIGWNLRENLAPGDHEYIYLFERICVPIIEQFEPELIIVSAGFDAALGDPIGKCLVTELGYCYMMQRLMELQKKIVLALEGGYEYSCLKFGAESVLRILLGEKLPIIDLSTQIKAGVGVEFYRESCMPNQLAMESCKETLKYIEQYWPVLKRQDILDYEALILKNYENGKNITGGHKTQVQFDGEMFLKQSKPNEIKFYQTLDCQENPFFKENQLLKEFMPKFFGVVEEGGKQYLKLENMVHNREKGSLIDIKLGKIVTHKSSPKEKLERDILKAKQTTSGELHFKVCGCNIKNQKGDIAEKFDQKTSPKEKIPLILQKLLKSNDLEEVNGKALSKIIEFLERYLYFFQNQNSREFIAMSIFIIIDNTSDSCEVRAIDFNYVDPIEGENKLDMNVIPGLINLISYFKDLQTDKQSK